MEIKIVRQIMEWNENCHLELQAYLNEKKVLMINIMGSPGTGKTTFIIKLIESLRGEYNIGVIEADIAGKIDAEKIANMGIPVVQLNTEGACHIEALAIKNMLPEYDLDKLDIMLIENIGNLVCPAEFDIGEDIKLAILSIPEGDDKVEKYPLMFTRAHGLILSKYDMLPYFDFDETRVVNNALNINKNIKIFRANSNKNEGIEEISDWIKTKIKKASN